MPLCECSNTWSSWFVAGGRHGNAERVYRLEFVSNHAFTDNEFHKWRETMALSGLDLPSVYDIEKKVADIKFAMNYSFKESDIEQVCVQFFFCLLCILHHRQCLALLRSVAGFIICLQCYALDVTACCKSVQHLYGSLKSVKIMAFQV